MALFRRNILLKTGICKFLLKKTVLLEDQELALDLTNTLKRYSDACDEIVKSKKKNLETKMNPKIGQFADMADANYIILIKGLGFGSSGGAIARDAVINVASLMLFGGMSISQYDGLILEIAIVDANSSEIIYFNRNLESKSKYLPLSKGSCKKLLYQLLDEKVTTKYVSNRKRSRW